MGVFLRGGDVGVFLRGDDGGVCLRGGDGGANMQVIQEWLRPNSCFLDVVMTWS